MTADTSMMGAIGQLRDDDSNAVALANGWHDYAKRLELQVSQLQATVQSVAETAQEEIAKVADLKIERIATNEKLANAQMNKDAYADRAKANEAYGKQFRFRLQQMEKALQHSSTNLAAIWPVLKAYREVVERMNLTNELPDDLREKAQTIWEKFSNGEEPTVDHEIQAIIDVAPVPKRPPGAFF